MAALSSRNMAESNIDVTDLILCRHCNQVYTDPCQLPCGDTVCRQCFMDQEQTVSSGKKKQPVRKCPVCMHESRADGSQLKFDVKTAWIVKTHKDVGCKRKEVIIGICSIPQCSNTSTGHGLDFEEPLCAHHLLMDEENFAGKLASVQSTVERQLNVVKDSLTKARTALHEVSNDRAEVADLFDAIFDQLQECRRVTLHRLDSTLESLERSMQTTDVALNIETDIEEAKSCGNKKLSYQLYQQLQLVLRDMQVDEIWKDPTDFTLQLTQELFHVIQACAEEVKLGQNSAVEWPKPTVHHIDANLSSIVAIVLCNHTEGYSCENGTISQNSSGVNRLPPTCIIVLEFKKKKCLSVNFFDKSNSFLGKYSMPQKPELVSAHCASHLQQLYMLLSDSSLLVTDLAGTQLHWVQTLQMEKPLCVTGSGEKIYALGSNGHLVCLSAESCEIQERVQLPDDVKGAIGVAVLGQRLVLMTEASVYCINTLTKSVSRFFVPQFKDLNSRLTHVTSLGFGCVGIRDNSGSEKVVTAFGKVLQAVPNANDGILLLSSCSEESFSKDFTFEKRRMFLLKLVRIRRAHGEHPSWYHGPRAAFPPQILDSVT